MRCHPLDHEASISIEPTRQYTTKEEFPTKTYLDEDDISVDELNGLKNLANNLVEDWPKLHFRTIEDNLAETITNIR